MIPDLDAAHGEERAASRLSGALRARARDLAARLGRACPGGRIGASARRRSSARASSSWKTSSVGCCSSRSGRRRERSALAQLQPAVSLETLAEQAALARDAGREGGERAAELLARIVASARDREREQTQALNALRARWQQALGLAGFHRGAAAGGARQGIGQGHAVAEVAVARPQAARRAATARRAEAGSAPLRPCSGSYLEAVCVDGLDTRHRSPGELRRRASRGRERERGRGAAVPDAASPAGESAGRAVLEFGALARCSRPRRLAEALKMRRGLAAGSIGSDARRHLAGRRTGCGCRAIPSRTPA